jgi:hypothetical protein
MLVYTLYKYKTGNPMVIASRARLLSQLRQRWKNYVIESRRAAQLCKAGDSRGFCDYLQLAAQRDDNASAASARERDALDRQAQRPAS